VVIYVSGTDMKLSVKTWFVFPALFLMEHSYVMSCNVSEVDIRKHQSEFDSLVSSGMGMIYTNVSSQSFENITLTQEHWNSIIDWVWVTNEYKHFLSYPEDIHVFTMGLMKQNVSSLRINVGIENIEHCTSDKLSRQVYKYLFQIHNASDGYFCHRYFENQRLKEILFNISHVSIGYGFHCFQRNDFSSPVIVEKSGIVYITILIVLILFSYYPLILSPFKPSKEYQPGGQLHVYTKADYPYAPRRLFLHVFFKTNGIPHLDDVKRPSNILRCFGGMRLTIIITIITGMAYALRTGFLGACINCLPPNAFIYDKIYVFDRETWAVTFFTIYACILLFLIHVYILYIPLEDHIVFVFLGRTFLQSIPVSCFLNGKQIRAGNNSVVMLIVTRFCLMFSKGFWSKLFSLPFNFRKDSRCRIVLKLTISPIIFVFNASLFIAFSCFPVFNLVYLASSCYFFDKSKGLKFGYKMYKSRPVKRKYVKT
jgi:hypothetical protein